jgi:hypothetical protein
MSQLRGQNEVFKTLKQNVLLQGTLFKKKHPEVERAASLALIYHQINKII